MKQGIHPEYVECSVKCSCGNTFTTRSTKPELKIDICNVCHPFYTGQQRFVDTGGRVQRFADKFGAAKEQVAAREAAKKAEAEATAKKLKDLTVKIAAKAGEGGRLFGAVTAKEVSEALSEQYGVNIAKTKLVLDEPIKACGGYQIKAKLGYEVVGTVSVMVTEA